MQKRKSSNAAHKAWNILRIALIWARKGGVMMHKRKLMMHLPKFIKTLRETRRSEALYHGDRQLSFGDTPVIHVKMHRPNSMRFRLPCINPGVDFGDDELYLNNINDVARMSFLSNGDDTNEEEEGIDLKEQEFIAKFYEQLKLQRQISCLQYK